MNMHFFIVLFRYTSVTTALIFLTVFFFFFNDTATTEIYTLSLHDALPIYRRDGMPWVDQTLTNHQDWNQDRKSTRLNSSHLGISYAVFCLKKKKHNKHRTATCIIAFAILAQRRVASVA